MFKELFEDKTDELALDIVAFDEAKEYDKMNKQLQGKIEKLRDSIFDMQTEFQGTKFNFDYKYYLKEMRNMAVKINNAAKKDL